MTTYSLNGYYIEYGDFDSVTFLGPTRLDIVVEPGVTSLSYYYEGFNEDGQPNVLLNGLFETVWLNEAGGLEGFDAASVEAVIVDVTWNYNGASGTSTVLAMYDMRPGFDGEYIYVLGGSPLPTFTTAAEWAGFDQAITAVDFTAAAPFAANTQIPLSILPASVSEDDTIFGTSGADDISGGDGYDELYGNGGADTLRGGAGENWMVLTNPVNGALVEGGADFDDMVIVDDNTPLVHVNFAGGASGNQLLVSGLSSTAPGATTVWQVEGTQIDRVAVDIVGDLLVTGGAGNDRIRLNSIIDMGYLEFQGGAGEDRLDLHRTFYQDEFGDIQRGFSSSDFIEAVILDGTADNLVIGDDDARLVNVETIRFTDGVFTTQQLLDLDNVPSQGNDNLTGTPSPDTIDGLGGADRILGLGGNDVLRGGDGNDSLYGSFGFDTLEGGAGADLLEGEQNADVLLGEAGNDTLIGGEGTDRLEGGADDDQLFGGDGADRLFGGDGNDLIRAGTNFGNSVDGVEGGAGNDTIFGEGGFDLLIGGDGADYIDGGAQADNLRGDAGNDTLIGGGGFDRLFGGAGDDLLQDFEGNGGQFGDDGNDTMQGGGDSTLFLGGRGNDLIEAGGGNDTIGGGAGFDTIIGGIGNDLMFGDFNADTFVFVDGHGQDTIGDFDALSDIERIDLRGVSAITGLADLDLGSTTSGAATQVGADVLIDTGDGNSILLRGVTLANLGAGDFLF